MNLLPKKSWHVRTKKNIERVRKDEAEAEKSASIEQDRILRAEQEVRIRELRSRAGIAEPENQGQINLFEDSKDHQQSTNKEYCEEKKQEEAKWQQKLGIINKLVRSEDINSPWYCSDRPEMSDTSRSAFRSESKVKSLRRSELIASIYDPMTAMKDAERLVRAKRFEKIKLEELNQPIRGHETNGLDLDYHKSVPPPPCSAKFMITSLKGRPQLAQLVESDSSPEIVKIIKNHTTLNNRERKHERKKSKKHKKCSHKNKSRERHHKSKRHKR